MILELTDKDYIELFFYILSSQLTADQNLKFIEPFCKILARTKEYVQILTIFMLTCFFKNSK